MRYICVHGHFYQPPRENPWLEAIELQESAHPYHDWNERINAECYSPNATSRILDNEHRIVRIVNNYSKLSFNFGPTLISWIEANDPGVYQAILDADAESQRNFSGHGSALAQPYNHMIMPLANDRDRHTQAVWGIRDFRRRFGRDPEGMWLPEAAVDLRTLETLAELGIQITILAPNQASRVRNFTERKWINVSGSRIDPTMASLVRLASGRRMVVFFYDGPISLAIAFERLLENGEQFAQRLVSAFPSEERGVPPLVHIATDGETYGHHHRYGEMALSYALNYIESNQLAQLTNYGEFLERYPPARVAEIFENSSWSCVHGVERWRSNCGCNSGGHPGWNQEWRAPLREAFDWLRDRLAPSYELKAKEYLKDPWAARNEYIDVILDRSPETRSKFLHRHAIRELRDEEQVTVWKLLEIQRHAMLMYSSCGWFFDELSGMETVQVMEYAGRAVQLGQELFGDSLENTFVEMLSKAKSNIAEHGDGGNIYHRFVKPAFVDLRKVAAHYGIRSLFEPYELRAPIYDYSVEFQIGKNVSTGSMHGPKLAVGRARFTSEVTQESAILSFAAFGHGDLNPFGGILKPDSIANFEKLMLRLEEAFTTKDLSSVTRILSENYEGETYRLAALFRDDQRSIIKRIVESEWTDAEAAFRNLYPHLISIIRTMVQIGGAQTVIPRAFYAVAEFALNSRLRSAFLSEQMDFEEIRRLISDAQAAGVPFDQPTLEYTLRRKLEEMAERFRSDIQNLELLKWLEATVGLARSLPIDLNLWKTQNICYDLLEYGYPEMQRNAQQGDPCARLWIRHFRALAEKLSLRVA